MWLASRILPIRKFNLNRWYVFNLIQLHVYFYFPFSHIKYIFNFSHFIGRIVMIFFVFHSPSAWCIFLLLFFMFTFSLCVWPSHFYVSKNNTCDWSLFISETNMNILLCTMCNCKMIQNNEMYINIYIFMCWFRILSFCIMSYDFSYSVLLICLCS